MKIDSSGCQKEFSPNARRVLKTLHLTWPQLGRAPSIEDVHQRARDMDVESVKCAFDELNGNYIDGIQLASGSYNIQWAWPFSSKNLGIQVSLEKLEPVFARCAVDALGMSAMFSRRAIIVAESKIWKKEIQLEINISSWNSLNEYLKPVVSLTGCGGDCDQILFFVSVEEWKEYTVSNRITNGTYLSIEDALKRGMKTFGARLEASENNAKGGAHGLL